MVKKPTTYKCGHSHNGILILDCNELSYIAYEEWASTVGLDGDRTECFDCWNRGKGQ